MVSTSSRDPIFCPERSCWACGAWVMLSCPPATTRGAPPGGVGGAARSPGRSAEARAAGRALAHASPPPGPHCGGVAGGDLLRRQRHGAEARAAELVDTEGRPL